MVFAAFTVTFVKNKQFPTFFYSFHTVSKLWLLMNGQTHGTMDFKCRWHNILTMIFVHIMPLSMAVKLFLFFPFSFKLRTVEVPFIVWD